MCISLNEHACPASLWRQSFYLKHSTLRRSCWVVVSSYLSTSAACLFLTLAGIWPCLCFCLGNPLPCCCWLGSSWIWLLSLHLQVPVSTLHISFVCRTGASIFSRRTAPRLSSDLLLCLDLLQVLVPLLFLLRPASNCRRCWAGAVSNLNLVCYNGITLNAVSCCRVQWK